LAQDSAFTLLELLVVIAMMALLGGTLLPAMARTKPNTNAIQCLNNNRQLNAAWRMYADDNLDRLVYSSDDGTSTANPLNKYAWTETHLDFSAQNRNNLDVTLDIMTHPLWPYTGRSTSIYKCPSDTSYVVVNGVVTPRVRSMSMNFFLGGMAGGNGGEALVDAFCLYTNLTQIGGGLPGPGPAKLWVFLDQRADSINWGNYFTDMAGYAPSNPAAYSFLQDFPGMYHHLAAGISFADGHCEMHRWTDPRTTPASTGVVFQSAVASPRNADVAWLQDHSTRPR
jgi:prepilin-type N-terminal cleavage/methylation domain-containing protein